MSGTDLQAVYNLLAQYGLLLDRLDVDEWLDLFTDDAVLDVGGTPLDSRGKRRHLTMTAPRGLHVSNLPVIDGDLTSDQVHVTATFLFWNTQNRTTRIGWYDDRLRRVGNGWRFESRRINFLD